MTWPACLSIGAAKRPNRLSLPSRPAALARVSWLAKEQIATAEQILGNYQLAGNFRRPNIIADPSGELTRLQAAIPGAFAKQRWVMKRCEHARGNVLDSLSRLHTAAAFHEQVTAWLFAAGITTHILLTAGLKNPTVRRRYAAVRRLLAQHGRGDFHERLLELLGCGQMRQGQAERHLVALARAFDAAKGVVDSSYPFAADLSDAARAVAIDGSRELIERGLHREAVFWMVATSSRCQAVFHQNASQAMQEEYSNGFRALLGDLGITSFADLERRGEEVRAFLPRVWEVAEALMAANPEIEDAVQE